MTDIHSIVAILHLPHPPPSSPSLIATVFASLSIGEARLSQVPEELLTKLRLGRRNPPQISTVPPAVSAAASGAPATSSRVEEERPKRSQMAHAFSREPCRLCS